MSLEAYVGKVGSSNEDWLDLSLIRRSNGLEIGFKVHPKVEEFMASLSDGGLSDPLELHGRSWEAVDNPIRVYRIDKELVYDGFLLSSIGTNLTDRNGHINLSFLQFVGASKDKVRFFIPGPIQADYMRNIVRERILNASRKLFHQYVTPVSIRLRITSEET